MNNTKILEIAKEFRKSYLASILLVLFFGPFGLFYSTITYGVIMSIIFIAGLSFLVPPVVHDLMVYLGGQINPSDFSQIIYMLKDYDYFKSNMFILLCFYSIVTLVSLGLCVYYIYLYNKNTYSLALSLNEYKEIVNNENKDSKE
jgi:hypothetical protein